MTFRRILAILLLLLLPLQSTLAMADMCCVPDATAQTAAAGQTVDDGQGADCCTACDVCHHASTPLTGAQRAVRSALLDAAPAAAPEPPFDSFIPDVPPRPDRAA